MLAVKLPISKLDGSFFFFFPVFPPPLRPPFPPLLTHITYLSKASSFLGWGGSE